MHDYMKTIISAIQSWVTGKIKDSTADWNQNDASAENYIKNKPDIPTLLNDKMDKDNPVGTGSFSMNRKAGTIVGDCSHAEGTFTTASGVNSHAEGLGTNASGSNSHAEGSSTKASGSNSHAEGSSTTASGSNSHAEGFNTKATTTDDAVLTTPVTNKGYYTHAEGYGTVAYGAVSHAEGNGTKAGGNYSHSEGRNTLTSGESSHAEGHNTEASGDYSHAEGTFTTAFGESSHAEGIGANASGQYSHAEGSNTTALGVNSHAEGRSTKASDANSHAEGDYTTASGESSHAEGANAIASGSFSHAEGYTTTASGISSHAEGAFTTASGSYSHTEGYGTRALVNYQHAQGSYNIDCTAIHVVGNGESDDSRSNAHTLDWEGNAWFAGNVYVGSTSGTNRDDGSKKLATVEELNMVTVEVFNTIKNGIVLKDTVNGYNYIIQMKNGNLVSSYACDHIELTAMPTKTNYIRGEAFDTTGMIITAVMPDGSTKVVEDYSYPECVMSDRVEVKYTEIGITHTISIPVTITEFDAATVLIDFTYTTNNDGTYTITGWKQTLNGVPSTEMVIPNNGLIIV